MDTETSQAPAPGLEPEAPPAARGADAGAASAVLAAESGTDTTTQLSLGSPPPPDAPGGESGAARDPEGSLALWEHEESDLPMVVGPVLEAPLSDPPGPSGPGDGPDPSAEPPGPSEERRKGVSRGLAAVLALGGVALLSIPFLVLGGHKKQDTAGTTLGSTDSIGQLQEYSSAPPLNSASPSAKPSASSKSKKASASGKPAPAAHGTIPLAPLANVQGAAKADPKKTPAKPQQQPKPLSAAAQFGGASSVLLQNLGTGLCADLPNYGKGKNGGAVNQYYCQAGSADNQMWTLQVMSGAKGPGGARLFSIRNDKDALCMDLPWMQEPPAGGTSSQYAGSVISEYICNPATSDDQLWYLAPGAQNHYEFRNYRGGLCLTVDGGASAGHDARLEVNTCGSTATDWTWTTG